MVRTAPMHNRSCIMKKQWILGFLLLIILLFTTPFVWWEVTATRAMRESKIPATYSCEGAWGTSVLVLKPNHTFLQTVHFTNEYTGADEGSKNVQGVWSDKTLSQWTYQLELDPFVQLAPWQKHAVLEHFETSYSMMLFGPRINVEPGAGIYYMKSSTSGKSPAQ